MGNMTCCRLAHPGGRQCDKELLVPSALAMYADLHLRTRSCAGSCADDKSVQQISELFSNEWRRLFPARFPYQTQGRRPVQRDLFGNMIPMLNKQLKAQAHAFSSTPGQDEQAGVTTFGHMSSIGAFELHTLTQQQRAEFTDAACQSDGLLPVQPELKLVQVSLCPGTSVQVSL